MPDTNGVAVLNSLTDEGLECHVIAYSAQGNDTVLRAALDAGAQDCLIKLAPVDTLIAAIDHLIPGSAPAETYTSIH